MQYLKKIYFIKMVASLFIIAIGIAQVDAAPEGGNAGLGYECSRPIGGETPECSCSGYLDCRNLEKSGNCCPLNEANCSFIMECSSPTGGGAETCSCDWQRAKVSDRFPKRPNAPVNDKLAPAEQRDHRTGSSKRCCTGPTDILLCQNCIPGTEANTDVFKKTEGSKGDNNKIRNKSKSPVTRDHRKTKKPRAVIVE